MKDKKKNIYRNKQKSNQREQRKDEGVEQEGGEGKTTQRLGRRKEEGGLRRPLKFIYCKCCPLSASEFGKYFTAC